MSRGPDASARLVAALRRHANAAGCWIELVDADAERWASVTFTGARHTIVLDTMACAELDRWLSDLPDAELGVRGHLVADLTVAHTATNGDARRIRIEALTVEN